MSNPHDREALEFVALEEGISEDLTATYKENPSIETYVKLRRENPDDEIEVRAHSSLEHVFFLEPELRKFGFDPSLVTGSMDGNAKAISELSLQILEKIISSRSLAKSGKTHLARRGLTVPDKLITWLITCMLEGLSWSDQLHIPRDLIFLIRECLGGSNPEYDKLLDAHEKRKEAIWVGSQLKARGINPTIRMLSRIFKVAPSTVKRWFPAGDFSKEVTRLSSMFDEKGNHKLSAELAEIWKEIKR